MYEWSTQFLYKLDEIHTISDPNIIQLMESARLSDIFPLSFSKRKLIVKCVISALGDCKNNPRGCRLKSPRPASVAKHIKTELVW